MCILYLMYPIINLIRLRLQKEVGNLKKKFIVFAVLSMALILSGVLIFATDAVSVDKIPKEVVQIIENKKIGYSLAKDYYTIGEKGFSVNYIRSIAEDQTYASLDDLLYKQDHWLFVLEQDSVSVGTILIGKESGKYEVLVWGESGEMFYHTLALADPSGKNEVTLLSYAGNYYFINSSHEVYQVPRTKMEYDVNPYVLDTPIPVQIFLDLVLNNKN